MNLSAVVGHHAERRPAAIALTSANGDRTWQQLSERTARTAGALAEAGVRRGDVVGVLLHNSIEYIEVMLGVAHLGAVFMPLNWRLAPAELAYICGHAGAAAMVSEPELAAGLETSGAGAVRTWFTLGAGDRHWVSLADAQAAATPMADAADVEGDDLHRLMYTSGTSARPKGVMISYANVYWKCAGQVVELGLTREDRGLACGPLYHVGALDLTTTNMLYVGGSTHIVRRFDVGEVLTAIAAHAITNVWLAPAMINAILGSGQTADAELGSVRVIVDGGEKMPLPLIEQVLAAFPNAWFADAYGLTETVGGDTYLDKGATLDKLGSVGKPILHTEVRVVDASDASVAPGEVGEIVIRGPKVCKGYWADEAATASAMRGGWFHTGDLGYLDDDGFLFIVDRVKDVIISGGENVASLEVERVLYEHADVVEAAVVASPHERWNEVPVAYVVLREDASEDADGLDRFCRERLASYKAPKGFRFVDALPRNPSGKVLKRELREREAVA